jgi:DNA processing protein
MAMGIDAIAHYGCLKANGKTIAFLGCGVDVIYPAVNAHLYHEIIQKDGLIISEFPPGHTVLKGLFIARNRLISGLSQGILVVEGAKDSGALITARYAAEQGKEVFAIPSSITSELSAAPNYLIKQGAKLVTSVQDIFDEYNIRITPKNQKDIIADLSGKEKMIVETLIKEPLSADNLVLLTKLKTAKVLSILSTLEIKGVVEKNSEGKYQVA